MEDEILVKTGIYSQLSTNDTHLPTSWNPREKYNYLGLSNNNLRVHYKGGPGKSHKDAASVRANHPIPAACGIYYFEIVIISRGKSGYIGVGLSDNSVHLGRLPGWDKYSYGYHADDGKVFCASSNTGEPYGPTFTTGDTIGCGINLIDRSIFYTKNGIHLGIAFKDIPVNMKLYPVVGLQTQGEIVEANFGTFPFKFDFPSLMAEAGAEVKRSVLSYPLGDSEAKWQTKIHKLVLDYLTVHGCSKTAESFARCTGQELKEPVSSIKNRQEIQSLILSGRLHEAIATTEARYPGLLDRHKELLFRLKCRQFIEMISGADTSALISEGSCSPYGRGHPSSSSPRPHSSSGIYSGSPRRVYVDSPALGNDEQENGRLSNGVNGHSLQPAEEECAMETTHLTGLPCGGNRVAIENLLAFGQSLQVMLQEMELSCQKKSSLQTQLRDAFSLIAYSNINSCPVSYLLAHQEREEISLALNSTISSSLCLPPKSLLEVALGHVDVCMKVLTEHSVGSAGFIDIESLLEQ